MMPRKRRTEPQKDREAAQARARRLSARLAPVPMMPTVVTGVPTELELVTLAETFIHGNQADAALCLDTSIQNIKNRLTSLYEKLGATSGKQAATLLGWIAFPRGLIRPHRAALSPLPDAVPVHFW